MAEDINAESELFDNFFGNDEDDMGDYDIKLSDKMIQKQKPAPTNNRNNYQNAKADLFGLPK